MATYYYHQKLDEMDQIYQFRKSPLDWYNQVRTGKKSDLLKGRLLFSRTSAISIRGSGKNPQVTSNLSVIVNLPEF